LEDIMRDEVLLGARMVLGGYMGIHASQKLLGKFHGPGLEKIGELFEKKGLAPGKQMATMAAATELAGGFLTITGLAYPAGPLAIAGAMTVAAGHNLEGGLMAATGGVEVPVGYFTLALTLAATGPGKYKIGPSLPVELVALGAFVGGAASAALIAKMITFKPPVAEEPAPAEPASGSGSASGSPSAEPAA
jgi:putative oxidoreductase